jgi:Ca-activated chloride channel homolog
MGFTGKFAIFAIALLAIASAKPLLLVIDASGSMDDTLPSGKTKLETAKSVAVDTINSYGDTIALMVYTDCDSSGDPMTGNIRVYQDFTTDKASLTSQIEGITAESSTPIANAVSEGVTYISSKSPGAQMLVLTDGEETCGGDVSSAISSAESSGVSVKVVGFALDNASTATLRTAVQSGGGQYYNAGDETELRSAFQNAIGDSSCCASSMLFGLLGIAAFAYSRKN